MIRRGDIVELGRDPSLHAIVEATSRDGITRGHLIVRPLCGLARSTRDVRVSDVVRHWRRAQVRVTRGGVDTAA